MEEVKLLGLFASPFTYRVIWALKMKGINYTYIEDDISNKSALLLESNPVHKKLPVLIHGGKPIPESTVILEYIEETWPENPLLPKDPYQRAVARFWVKFAEDKFNQSFGGLFLLTGENQEKARKDCLEIFRIIEEESCLGKKKFFGGDEIGLVDLVYGVLAHWIEIMEEVVGVKLMDDAQKFSCLSTWMENFRDVPVIKENRPDHEKIVSSMKSRREMLAAAAAK